MVPRRETQTSDLLLILTGSLCWTQNRQQATLAVLLLKPLIDMIRSLGHKSVAVRTQPGRLSS